MRAQGITGVTSSFLPGLLDLKRRADNKRGTTLIGSRIEPSHEQRSKQVSKSQALVVNLLVRLNLCNPRNLWISSSLPIFSGEDRD